MEFKEAKEKLIQSWGTLGSSWGINRTMAQIHALLLVSIEPLCAEEVMEELNISRGNANMNLRALIDWGLVMKEHKPGERKEFFVAEKDMWEVARRIMAERKKREIEPIIRMLDQVEHVRDHGDNKAEVEEFKRSVDSVKDFVMQLDKISDRMSKADRNWFFNMAMKLIK